MSATHHHRKKERAEQADRAERQRQEEVEHNARSRAATSPNLVAAMFTRARDVSVSPQPLSQPLSSDSSASTSSASTSIALVGGHYLTADGSGPRLLQHDAEETEMSRRATTPMNMAVSDNSALRRIGIADVAKGVHCGICQDLFDNDADLFNHMLQTHKEQVAADVKFSSNGAILRQRASEPTLSASAPDARDLAKKRPKRRFKCLTSNCSAKFATEVELRQHIDETHAKHSLASLAFGPPKKPVTRADLLGK